MNICLLANHLNTGGVTSYVLNLARELVASGHNVWVAAAPGDCLPELKLMGAKYVRLDIKVKSEVHPCLLPALARLVAHALKYEWHVLHANTRVTQILAASAAAITRKAPISTCHGYFKTRLFRRMFPCWGRAVIAISRGVAAHLRDDFHVPSEQIHMIPNGINLLTFNPVTAAAQSAIRAMWEVQGTPVFGTIARYSDVKGIDVLLRAVPEVLAVFPNAQVIIAGDGPEKRRLAALAEQLGIKRAVNFMPVVRHTAELLPVFDVCVVPSRQEGLGLSAIEAQAAGVPVVASGVGGLVDVVKEGHTGVLVPPEDSGALAQAIIALLQSPERRQDIARAARLEVEQRFDAKHMCTSTVDVYKKIVTGTISP